MKRHSYFVGYLVMLGILSGYLLSKATLIGRFGMTFIYNEYSFLKTWWKGGLFVIGTWAALFLLQGYLATRSNEIGSGRKIQYLAIVLALAGLIITYLDFRNTLSHRLLGERFHLGAYLFWLGWVSISVYWITVHRPKTPIKERIL